jgi:formate hydrogenlyase subunit 5
MRLIARFCIEKEACFEIVDFFDGATERTCIEKSAPECPTITDKYPAAIWFERKISDDFGIAFGGRFDRRALLHHERFPKDVYPMRKSFGGSIEFCDYEPYPYEAIKGDGVFEVAVGPIHAGIIEPGHFHFSQEGENILHQEVRHFYKYRGIEKIAEGRVPNAFMQVTERISGNESIAYQIAYADLLSQAGGRKLDEGVRKYQALLLELERLVHHITDLGFICNDAGFASALAFCSARTEEIRRMLNVLTGSRFGFGALGRTAKPIDADALKKFAARLGRQMHFFEDWIIDIPSLWDRFDTTGILYTKKAIKYSCVGVVARACGLKLDCRDNDFYHAHGFELQRERSGDVAARFKVRLAEVFNSLAMIENFTDCTPSALSMERFDDGEYFSFVESALGELFLYLAIKEGRIERFFARDPSFVNWQALHLMMPGNIIADFPLINKSCDLSYAGNDL